MACMSDTTDEKSDAIQVFYWQGFHGRGLFLRAALAAAGMAWEEALLGKDDASKQISAYAACKGGNGTVFAPPFMKVNGAYIGQTCACVQYIARAGGMEPKDPIDAAKAMDICLTAADMFAETYKNSKSKDEEEKEKFFAGRMPSFLNMMAANKKAAGGNWLVKGDKPTCGDIYVAVTLKMFDENNPKRYQKIKETFKGVCQVRDNFEKLPNVAKFYASDLYKKIGNKK